MRSPLGPGGEFDLVRQFAERWGSRARELGDDAAVVPLSPGMNLVVSVDSSVENVHFRREWLAAPEIGYRATVAALSDLAAMAATPLGILVAITLPDSWRAEAAAIADGIGEAARATDADILGGDLSGGDQLCIALTVIGSAGRPLRRRGAQSGDRVYVTGRLGAPGAAVRAWSSGRKPDDAHAVRFARPTPRIAEAKWLADHGATAAIDISDGLIADLRHVAAASGVRIDVDLRNVPCFDGVDPMHAITSGEEYEIAVTCPFPLDVESFRDAFSLELTHVGFVVSHDLARVDLFDGNRLVDPPEGYDHFSR